MQRTGTKIMEKARVKFIIAGIILAIYALLISNVSMAQDQGYIYGTITTIDGKEYTGHMRWGKEETFWDDIFNSNKDKNPNIKYLDRDDYQKVKGSRYNNDDDDGSWWNWREVWRDNYKPASHQFAIRFGDIKSLRITGRNGAMLALKCEESVLRRLMEGQEVWIT